MFPERSELLKFVLESDWSDFYRTYYKDILEDIALPISSEDAWQRLPFLTRTHVGSTPLWRRLFLPASRINIIRPTSGTSGRSITLSARADGRPLLSYFTDRGIDVRGTLSFMNPHHHAEESIDPPVPVIGGDPMFPDLSVQIAAKAGVNTIISYTYFIDRLTAALRKTELHSQIEGVLLFGERISAPMREHILDLFPNAICIDTYGASELYGIMALTTLTRGDAADEVVYEALPEHHYFFELENERGVFSEPAPGMEGELIMTTLAPFARCFPMIRYKTGDWIKVGASHGPGNFDFSTEGRMDYDKLKLAGGVLWPHEVERALLRVLGPAFAGDYVFEVDTTRSDDHVRERATIFLPPELIQSISDIDACAENVAGELRTASARTYADGVRDGFYDRLVLQPLTRETQDRIGKNRRMVRKHD